MQDVEIVKGYIPGSIGRVAELHGTYYHAHWGFGRFFEAKVATELSGFLERYDQKRDGFWTALLKGRIEGSITIDGIHAEGNGAHLRWFIMSDALRGKGVGNRMMNAAIDFCRNKDYRLVYLWTFEGLDAARHLYEKAGFKLVEQHRGTQWGLEVNEQRFELLLGQHHPAKANYSGVGQASLEKKPHFRCSSVYKESSIIRSRSSSVCSPGKL